MAALATSCSDDIASDGAHKVSLSASVTAETTRAAFLSNGQFYWSTDDQIGVTTTNQNTDKLGFSALELKSGAGSGSATFEGTIVGGIGSYAVYPYNKDHSLNGATLTYAFPASYNYTKVDQTFFPESKDGNSYNPAMWASISNNNVTFKHLGGVFLISIEKMPYASGTLEVSSEAYMAGKFTSNLSGSEPKCENTQTNVDGASKNVTITFAGASVGQPGVFYVPVPVGTYKNLTITFKSGESVSKKVVAGNYTIRRKLLKKLKLNVPTDAETSAVAESVDAVQNQLASSNNVELTAELKGTDNTITVPEVTTDVTTQKAKTVTLTKIADGASFELKDAASTTGGEASTSKSVKEITVSIPNVEDADKAPEVTVSMPNSTVTLAGNAGTATFKKVSASTAEHTLIVTDGVTIRNLEILKGNVRINKGATVDTIHAKVPTIVYYEKGATVHTTVGEKVKKYEIEVGQDHHVMVWDGTVTEPTAKTTTDGATTYEIISGSELAWFAQQTRKSSDAKTFKDVTIKLMGDINLNKLPWSGIGYDDRKDQFEAHAFAGTFDGNGHTIYNLNVSSNCKDPDRATAGLFNTVATGATIKNLKIKVATIRSTHYAGGIVGYSYAGSDQSKPVTIENCTVDSATIITTPALKVDSNTDYDSGDKAGGIIGYLMYANVKDCTVKNTTIKAYRDFGGIGGCANKVGADKKCEISNCTVTNVTLTVDNTHNYKKFTKQADYNVDKIIGRPDDCVTTSSNTADKDVKIVYPDDVTN